MGSRLDAGIRSRPLVAYSLEGGDAVRLCETCLGDDGPGRGDSLRMFAWSPDRQYVYITLQPSSKTQHETGKTYGARLAKASTLPPAFNDKTDVA